VCIKDIKGRRASRDEERKRGTCERFESSFVFFKNLRRGSAVQLFKAFEEVDRPDEKQTGEGIRVDNAGPCKWITILR
jgi:hypothetical protein